MHKPKLLIATHNPGKIREYEALLADLPLTVTSLRAEGITQDVEETGATFAENARLKAETYAAWSGFWTWADDSGLEVDVLAGRPGVYSARYGGPGLSDRERYERLLAELRPFPPATWTARFRCAVALALPPHETLLIEETVEGIITDRPRGDHGFGYDPVFFLPPFSATMAELPPAVKNQISHRAKAAAKAKQQLAQFMARLD
ncbi:MAG: non-canonical purine NTP pyrophosphatase, RdgB/HAM1 family [Chloroflexi bacterium]|nr:MAG: non-canonical purine NTP pyrophosphatase, RdgB/HAM1 family [Chloroflexota bacterium]